VGLFDECVGLPIYYKYRLDPFSDLTPFFLLYRFTISTDLTPFFFLMSVSVYRFTISTDLTPFYFFLSSEIRQFCYSSNCFLITPSDYIQIILKNLRDNGVVREAY
jgi:hypothetical protein